MKDHLKLLQAFLAAGKPDWVETIDILLTAHLIARADAKMTCRVSWDTLAICSQVNRSTVYRSVARLEDNDHCWIVKHSGKRRQTGNTYVVQVRNLPLKDFTHTIVTEEAEKLAFWYLARVRGVRVYSKRWKKPVSPKVRKGWEQRWAFVMQAWLNQGFTTAKIQAGVILAFQHDPQRAVNGPHALKQAWPKIMAAIDGAQRA